MTEQPGNDPDVDYDSLPNVYSLAVPLETITSMNWLHKVTYCHRLKALVTKEEVKVAFEFFTTILNAFSRSISIVLLFCPINLKTSVPIYLN